MNIGISKSNLHLNVFAGMVVLQCHAQNEYRQMICVKKAGTQWRNKFGCNQNGKIKVCYFELLGEVQKVKLDQFRKETGCAKILHK